MYRLLVLFLRFCFAFRVDFLGRMVDGVLTDDS
jgi:hypothetical protein